MERAKIGDYVSRCASLATLMEVSAYPKPGNVHRTRDFPETRFEHFLAGGVALGPEMRELALRGQNAISGTLDWEHINLGRSVLNAVDESLKWQGGGNVNLGVLLLFSPIAAAAGATLYESLSIDAMDLRKNLEKVVKAASPVDTVAIYKAIQLAMRSENLGDVVELDVTDRHSLIRIDDEGLSPLDIFEKCAKRDSICSEWITVFQITFGVGLPKLKTALNRASLNDAIIDTFMHILSKYPDSLIIRKSGITKAVDVSKQATKILKAGEVNIVKGKKLLWDFDNELHESEGGLNPGTTADLTAASLFVLLLEGWRP
jgi:triphosphoribosyl-dephospho-CoA synthase|tara:strand:- start:1236 stop:2186 length:951 start_codon:yes stop_codon:yes gene_type:complete